MTLFYEHLKVPCSDFKGQGVNFQQIAKCVIDRKKYIYQNNPKILGHLGFYFLVSEKTCYDSLGSLG